MRRLAGLWLWEGLERTGAKQREEKGLDYQEFGEGELSKLEGEGRKQGQGARGRPGAAVARCWRLRG